MVDVTAAPPTPKEAPAGAGWVDRPLPHHRLVWGWWRNPGKHAAEEINTVSRRVREKALSALGETVEKPGTSENPDDDAAVRLTPRAVEDMVRYRVRDELWAYFAAGPWDGRLFTTLTLFGIVAGLTSTVIASDSSLGSGEQWAIRVLGGLVGLVGGIQQARKPAQRSTTAYRAGYALRAECWDYVLGAGRYGRVSGERGRLRAFIDEVRRINRGAESTDEGLHTQTTDPPTSG
jgi:hypothetical protein